MPIPADWQEVQLRDSEGQPCGCWRFFADDPNTACPTHAAAAPEHGHLELAAALRRVGYNGKIFLQYPVWSVPGRHLSRRPGGTFTSAPEFYVDMVLEITGDAARACRKDCMVGIEVDGPEHEQAVAARLADKRKEAAVIIPLLRVSVTQVQEEDDGDYDHEAQRAVDALGL